MNIIQKTYKDDLICKDTTFTYNIYEDISDKELIDLFENAQRIENNRLWKGTAKNWIGSKIVLYGIYMSRPELFAVYTASGLNSPYSYYEITLKI